MAIIYTIGDEQFEIGSGFATQGAAESPNPILNPFPRYSISREYISSGDDTHLGNRYSISVAGRLIVPSDKDMTDSGLRQNELHKQMIWHLQTLSTQGNRVHNLGKLEIIPHGGKDKPFIFRDARLRNIEFPEQDDDSGGVLYSDYTFQFEAYLEESDTNESFCLKVTSVEESWDLSLNEDEVSFYTESDGTPYKTYTLTHTLSANGIKSINNDATEITPAWKNAAEWIKTRLVTSPASPIISDVANNPDKTVASSYFYPNKFDSVTSVLCPDLSVGGYSFYNHIRTPNCNISEGSYSVTETWFISNMPATLEMDIELNEEDTGTITMSLTGTIKGLDSSPVNTKYVSKIDNAENVLSNVESKAYNILLPYYPVNTGGFSLQNVVRQKTIGRNKGTGIITFNYVFNDSPVLIPGAISSSLKIQDFNYNSDFSNNKPVETIAIIPIIGKIDGPIIQDMNTTPESKRSLEINLVMNRANRTNKPSLTSIYNSYKLPSSYVTNFDESWEPSAGVYSLNIEWTKQ
jgi:hypothetical protein